MLFFLRVILVHLFLEHSSAASLPLLLSHPLESPQLLDTRTSESVAASCDNLTHCRKLSAVVWSCLATIFACTWVSVHPNVPPPNQSQDDGGLCRTAISRGPHAVEGIQIPAPAPPFSSAWAGSFSSEGYPFATKEQLFASPRLRDAILAIHPNDITDKSKGDFLSKGVALLQGLWFSTQCLARVHQRLALTQLEVATLAYAVVKVVVWVLASSPPSSVPPPPLTTPLPPPPSPPSGPSPCPQNTQLAALGITTLVGTVFGGIHCAAWLTSYSTPVETWLWRSCSAAITVLPAALMGHVVLSRTREIPVYIAARLVLIVLPLMALRRLPPSAFVEVDWGVYIPHMGLLSG
ncbi:hypothetical protein B0H14DRAFT_3695283 [Mycena olivaceomarginata]|nr:hypothetical protein B0H14DRAFT_3695283 [Mycena olivaceomarginata]